MIQKVAHVVVARTDKSGARPALSETLSLVRLGKNLWCQLNRAIFCTREYLREIETIFENNLKS